MLERQATVRSCPTCRAIYRTDFERCPSDGSPLQLGDADPLIGSVIAKHYEIDALIGEGGMGRVYRAHHTLLQHRQVAIKVLLGDLAATIAMRLRFGQEAELASRLDHPNVVSVIDYGTDERLLFLVMELISGRTLGEVIAREAPLEPRRVIALARQLCHGLAHAHDRGLVHRDFKPDNVIVSPDDEHAVITDFGIAISRDEDASASRLTTAGIALGTPSYAAPEQTHRGTVDHRADLFALGVTLYEMLAGRLPFDGDAMQVVLRNASEAPPSIELRSGVRPPPALEVIVRRLMARRPDDRFATARDVLDALDALDAPNASPSAIHPVMSSVSSVALAPPLSRKRKVALVVAMSAVIGGVALLWSDRGRDEPIDQVDPVQQVEQVQRSKHGDLIVQAPFDPTRRSEKVDSAEPSDQADPTRRSEAVAVVEQRESIGAVAQQRSKLEAAQAATAMRPRKPIDKPARGGKPTQPSSNKASLVETPTVAEAPPVVHAVPAPVVVEIRQPDLPPPASPPAPPPTPPPFVARARAQFGSLRVRGSLTDGVISRALDRTTPRLRACFASAATASKRSPTTVVHVTFFIDDTRQAASVKASSSWPELGGCVRGVIATLRTEIAPDVGDVPVSVDVTFHPEAT